MEFDFISILNKYDFSCSFGNRKFSMFHDLKLVSSSSLSDDDNFYMLDTIALFNESLQLST